METLTEMISYYQRQIEQLEEARKRAQLNQPQGNLELYQCWCGTWAHGSHYPGNDPENGPSHKFKYLGCECCGDDVQQRGDLCDWCKSIAARTVNCGDVVARVEDVPKHERSCKHCIQIEKDMVQIEKNIVQQNRGPHSGTSSSGEGY